MKDPKAKTPIEIVQPYKTPPPFDSFDKDQGIRSALGSNRTKQINEAAEILSTNFVPGVSGWRLTPRGLELGNPADTIFSSSLPSSVITDFTEAAQDSIGAMIADTTTVDLTYTDATPALKADVIKQMSITADASGLKLSGDASTPGNSKYYGTDSGGSKGFFALPASGGTPGGDDTTIQFNNSGAFGGTKWLYQLPSALNSILRVEDQTVADTAGINITLWGSNGKGTGTGGSVDIFAGWDEGNVGFGGELLLAGSPTTGKPDETYVQGAAAVDGNGGDVGVFGGDGNGTDKDGGNIEILPGSATGSGANGTIRLLDPTAGTVKLDLSATSGTVDLAVQNQDGTIVVKTDSVALTAQTGDITDTALANAASAGLYRISYYILDTTADITAGAVTLNIKYTDNSAARTVSATPIALTATTQYTQATIVARLNSGNITYGVTHSGIFGSAAYALYLTCERII